MPSRRHHYVSRFYLENFIDPTNERSKPSIWVFERGKERPKAICPVNVAVRNDYYSIETRNGAKADVFERFLAAIEGEAAPALQRMAAMDGKVSHSDRQKLAFYIAVMLLRVPRARQASERYAEALYTHVMKVTAKIPGELERILPLVEHETGERFEVTADEIRKAILQDRILARATPVVGLEAIFYVSPHLVPIIYKMQWALIRAKEDDVFLTSDNPVVYVDPTHVGGFWGYGLASRDIELTFPLSPHHCLIAMHDKNFIESLGAMRPDRARQALREYQPKTSYTDADPAAVKEINRRTVHHANRFVFSSSNSSNLAKFIPKHLTV